jgi:hypothetical protein
MRHIGSRAITIALLSFGIAGIAVAADDALSSPDYQWLTTNLNVAPDSLTLQGLTPMEKAHVHLLINRASTAENKRLMEVADYLYRVNGQDFQQTLEQSER